MGNGESLKFYLSQKPFAQAKPALIDEEYLGPGLDPTTWVVDDPAAAVSVVAQSRYRSRAGPKRRRTDHG